MQARHALSKTNYFYIMKAKEARLVISQDKFRTILIGGRYVVSKGETVKEVTVTTARVDDLRKALKQIGISGWPTKRVAEKFYDEICKAENKLGWGESGIFYKFETKEKDAPGK